MKFTLANASILFLSHASILLADLKKRAEAPNAPIGVRHPSAKLDSER